jgi:hypothetical protein
VIIDCLVEPIQMPKLKCLELLCSDIDSYASIIRFFNGSNVKIFTYEEKLEVDPEHVKNLIDFFALQNELTELHMSNNVVRILFQDGLSEECWQALHLTKVSLSGDNLPLEAHINIGRFLTQQKSTLKVLELDSLVMTIELLITVLELSLNVFKFVDSAFESTQALNPRWESSTRVSRKFTCGHSKIARPTGS